MSRWIWMIIVVLTALSSASKVHAQKVYTHLVLAIDVSGSVNQRRWQVQRRGYELAFRDPDVVATLAMQPAAITVVQWAGLHEQSLSVPWTIVHSTDSARSFADAVVRMHRRFSDGGTAVGDALRYASSLFETAPGHARKRIIDISGDGRECEKDEFGLDVHSLDEERKHVLRQGITINGLPIKIVTVDDMSAYLENTNIDTYYETRVIGGPGAFSITVMDGDDVETFKKALVKKLLRELMASAE